MHEIMHVEFFPFFLNKKKEIILLFFGDVEIFLTKKGRYTHTHSTRITTFSFLLFNFINL